MDQKSKQMEWIEMSNETGGKPKKEPAGKRYVREFTGAMVLYMAVLFPVTAWLRGHETSSYRLPVALLPVIPVLLVAVAGWRFFVAMDELQKRILTETLSFAFVVTALLVITYGFMENAGMPKLTMWWVWLAMGAGWLIGCFLTARRYR